MSDADQLSIQVKEFALGWFRGEDGIDRSERAGISLGTTLSYLIWQATSSILRYTLQFESRIARGEEVRLDSDATALEIRVSQGLGISTKGLLRRSLVPQLDEQVILPSMLYVPRSARIVQTIQALIRPVVVYPTHLWITDWLTFHASRLDAEATVLYRKSLFRSAIPHSTQKNDVIADSQFPTDIGEMFNVYVLSDYLARRGISWTDNTVSAIANYVQETYRDIRNLLITASSQIQSMLDFYKPSKVMLPSDSLETWNLWYQICKLRNIETVMYMDGYAVIPFFPVTRTTDNSSWLVGRVAAYGSAQETMYRGFGYPHTNIEVVKPPFLLHQARKQRGNTRFEAVVLTWTPLNLNPRADTHSPALTLKTTLETLIKAGKRKIAVKLRWPGEVPYVRQVVSDLGLDIPILQGYLWQHLGSSSLFVGGISTAIAEVTAHGSRYIVFEPQENGYTDLDVARAIVISRDSIARTSDELLELLLSGASSWLGNPEMNLLN